jgi:hypothetical protein
VKKSIPSNEQSSAKVTTNTIQFDFNDPQWLPLKPERLKELGVNLNELWRNKQAVHGALVAIKKKYDEYAVNQKGLNYLCEAVQSGRVTVGVVVLARRQDGERIIINTKPVADVVALVANVTPRDDGFWPLLVDTRRLFGRRAANR